MLVVKNQLANTGDTRDVGSVPRLGRTPGEGNGNPPSFFAWRFPWTEEPVGLKSIGSQELDTTESNLAHMCI